MISRNGKTYHEAKKKNNLYEVELLIKATTNNANLTDDYKSE